MRETHKEQGDNEKQENNVVSISIMGDTVVCAPPDAFEGAGVSEVRGCDWCRGGGWAKLRADAFRHRDRQGQSSGGWQEHGVFKESSEGQGGWGLVTE